MRGFTLVLPNSREFGMNCLVKSQPPLQRGHKVGLSRVTARGPGCGMGGGDLGMGRALLGALMTKTESA